MEPSYDKILLATGGVEVVSTSLISSITVIIAASKLVSAVFILPKLSLKVWEL